MKDKLSRFVQTGEDLGNRELRRGIWFVRHKLFFRKATIIALSLWCTITVGWGLIIWGKYIFIDHWDDRDARVAQVQAFPNFEIAQPEYEASPLVFGQPQVFEGGEQKYDFVSPVTNKNSDMIAHVTYHFGFSSGQTAQQTVTLLPARDGHLAVFGSEHESFPARAQLMIDDIRWERIDHHVIPDAVSYAEARLQFEPEGLTFIEDGTVDAIIGASLTFDLTNNSVYSYWEGAFVVELFRGSQPVGVFYLSESPIEAGETLEIEQRLFQDIPGVSSITVTPYINVFDPSVYLPL